MRKWLPLIIITLLAGILRFGNLSSQPPAPNWDEVSHGYNAYSILETGKDEWGISFPQIFRAFGDYKLPLYIYLTTIPVFFFGLSVFSIRFISAFAGVLAIPGIFLLFSVLFPKKQITLKNKKIDLNIIAALFLAIMPWHFFFSRPALEANLALTLIIFGTYYLIKTKYLPSAILFALSLQTYNTERIFVPAILLAFLAIFRPKIKFKISTLIAIVILSLSAFLVVSQIFTGEGTARYDKLKILSSNTVFQIGQWRSSSTLPEPLPTIIYNRPTYLIKTVAANYLTYFTPRFIFQQKGVQTQFAIPDHNLFTWPILILAIIGVGYCLTHLKEKSSLFLLTWFFLSPLAASLTADPPQAIRPNPMIPAIICLSVLGLFWLINKFTKYALHLLLLSITSTAIFFGLYVNDYYTIYTKDYSGSWQYGYEQVYQYVKENKDKYQNIFITKKYGEPHIFYAFFNQLKPSLLQPGKNNIRFNQSDWYWTDKIDNVYFINDWDIPSTDVHQLKLESGAVISTVNSLLVSSDHSPKNANIQKTVKFLNGETAFTISSLP
ncbi:MAG TPA: hypothetical protein VLH94_00205 [Spirochaetia bacterium]|nr:hypothetical protein [Spirochaetia bacterium]